MSQSLVIESTLPGVIAIINAGQVARPIQRQPTSTAFVVGYSPWGPVNVPTVVTSWQDYVRQFGGFDGNSFLDDFLYTFFNIFPGKQAVVCRVVGGTTTLGTLSLKDQSTSPGVNTLRVDAKYPSTRADILVTVDAGTNANTFKLTVRSIFLGNYKEVWDNRTLATQSTLDEINQKSLLINVTNLNSVTAAPNNNPKVITETPLAAGTDDFADINVGTYVGTDSGTTKTGLQSFNDEHFGTGQVAIPGISSETAHAALVAHATTYHRLALLDPPTGASKTDMTTSRALYGTWYGALYWPWVEMLDYAGSGLTKFYPPSGFAAGACAEVDRTIGVHKAPANISIPSALDVERYSNGQSQTDDNTREYLNGHDVNVIAPLPEQGVKIYGARVLTGDPRVSFVHQIRLLNEFYYAGKLGYQWAVFSVVDGQGRLFRDLVATGKAFLRSYWEAGALFGVKEADAFSVVADSSNNPPQELELGRVHVQWGVKISPTAEQIILNIDNVPLFQDLSVLN